MRTEDHTVRVSCGQHSKAEESLRDGPHREDCTKTEPAAVEREKSRYTKRKINTVKGIIRTDGPRKQAR